LTAGSRLGPYEILSLLGAGGMGEVYRAHDTKLNRDVALKVLPLEFALDADRLARFKREAQVLASLNHPHIAAIYGFEDSGETHALVLELVEGPTLADRIAKGAIPLDEALPIAKQIAEALEAAHEQGIIHRDLKPANIKVREDGTVKVLDFGLAKAMEPVSAISPALTASPTITTPAMMTGVGMILGTAAYMSPEQARGKAVDKRADIWAFGVVLYELVAGRRPFAGEDVGQTLARVIDAEPAWDPVLVQMRRLLKTCLEKDPKRRLRDIGDAWHLLDEARPSLRSEGPRARPWGWLSAAVVTVVASLALWAPWRPPIAGLPLLRFNIYAPDKTAFANDVDDPPVVSPDGRRIAFLAREQDGRVRIWIQDLDALGARRLERTEEAHWPFWSPDGRWIAFEAGDNELKRVPASGGPPETLCTCPSILKGAWSTAGVIVFGNAQGVMKVAADGGPVTPLTVVDPSRGEVVHVGPSFLSDGHHFLYAKVGGMTKSFVGSIDASPADQSLTPVLDGFVQYASGRLLFLRGGTLMAQPFDNYRNQVSGDAAQIGPFAHLQPPVSGNDVLAYGGALPPTQLTWFSRDGKPVGTAGLAGQGASNPRISPDGSTVAFNRYDAGPGDIWLDEPKRGASQFTFGMDSEGPIWSPDGKRLAFTHLVGGGTQFDRKASDGIGTVERFYASGVGTSLEDWSSDNRFILFSVLDPKTKRDIWVLPGSGDKKAFPYLNNDYNEAEPRLSPDGKWLAYISDKLGHYEVYVDTFVGDVVNPSSAPRGTWPISTAGGTRPVWSRDGKELYFIGPDRKMMVVEVNHGLGSRFDFTAPKPLFDARISGNPWEAFDVSADGRFLMPIQQSANEPITVVANWPEVLKK
jgi:serine/threonine protein kinase/Tol biopolymer transport system component